MLIRFYQGPIPESLVKTKFTIDKVIQRYTTHIEYKKDMVSTNVE